MKRSKPRGHAVEPMRHPIIPLFWALSLWLATLGWLITGGVNANTAEGEAGSESVRRQVTQWVADLDSDRFDVRQQAAEKLQQWIARPELAALLATEFQRVLVAPNTSLEVRKRLERWQKDLPRATVAPASAVSQEEIDRLVRQLEDDVYSVRLSATKRLEWLLGNPKATYPIFVRLKQRLDAEPLSADARQWLEPIHDRARATWLGGDPSQWGLPPVSDAELAAWLEELARPGGNPQAAGAQRGRQRALRELRDVLGRDEYVGKLKELLQKRLADPGLDDWARARLSELVALTRPAMVAEYWSGGRPANVQHLYLGLPSRSPGVERPSHFDRIDDRVAHCVSGQNLSPGDYPVGVAIPHPRQPGAMFHLVNLSTPRRRMAYAFFGEADQRRRLEELSRRTLDRTLAMKRPLSGKELLVLGQLDAGEVSRFAGKYFAAVDDRPLSAEDNNDLAGRPRMPLFGVLPQPAATFEQPSLHAALCEQLVGRGTREAIPGLLEAIRAKRFLPPTFKAPRRVEWIAALAIAHRDPWTGVDDWLVGLLERTDRLIEHRPDGPELGATAAAILLARFGQEPAAFGLKPVDADLSVDVDLDGYLFTSPEACGKVRAWWAQRPAKPGLRASGGRAEGAAWCWSCAGLAIGRV